MEKSLKSATIRLLDCKGRGGETAHAGLPKLAKDAVVGMCSQSSVGVPCVHACVFSDRFWNQMEFHFRSSNVILQDDSSFIFSSPFFYRLI